MQGMNNLTEMYSAIKAEVPLPEDPATDTNMHFIHELKKANKVSAMSVRWLCELVFDCLFVCAWLC